MERCLTAEAAVALGLTTTLMALYEVGYVLLDDVGDGHWVRDGYMNGVGLLYVHGHLVGDRHLVGYLHGVWHFLLDWVRNLLLDVDRVGFYDFYRVGFLYLNFDRDLHGVGDFLLYGDGVGFLHGDFDFLVDDDSLDFLVGAAEAGLGVALGMAVALALFSESTEVAELGGAAGHHGQNTNLLKK